MNLVRSYPIKQGASLGNASSGSHGVQDDANVWLLTPWSELWRECLRDLACLSRTGLGTCPGWDASGEKGIEMDTYLEQQNIN